MLRAQYSSIRFEQAPDQPQVDKDELILNYLTEDIHAWLSGTADMLEPARESVKTLRTECGYTPFKLAQLLGVQLVDLLDLLK